MPRFERWDVIAVPFPYVERPIQQRRPALVTAAELGGSPDLLWVLMITAAANPRWPDDVEIDDHEGAGLPIASVVRTAKIATIEARAAQARRDLRAKRWSSCRHPEAEALLTWRADASLPVLRADPATPGAGPP